MDEVEYDKNIALKIQMLPQEMKGEVLDFIDFLLSKTKESRPEAYEARFDIMLTEARGRFREWLKEKGYDPETLTDDEIEGIIQSA